MSRWRLRLRNLSCVLCKVFRRLASHSVAVPLLLYWWSYLNFIPKQNGKIFCRRTACDCLNPSVDLFCCPECDTRVTSQCLDQNGHKLYRSGDNWTHGCQQCRCLVCQLPSALEGLIAHGLWFPVMCNTKQTVVRLWLCDLPEETHMNVNPKEHINGTVLVQSLLIYSCYCLESPDLKKKNLSRQIAFQALMGTFSL